MGDKKIEPFLEWAAICSEMVVGLRFAGNPELCLPTS